MSDKCVVHCAKSVCAGIVNILEQGYKGLSDTSLTDAFLKENDMLCTCCRSDTFRINGLDAKQLEDTHTFAFVYQTLSSGCSGSVSCGDVAGNVNAGGNASCGDIDGNLKAGGNVNCGDVAGDVQAGGMASCGDVSGSVNSGKDAMAKMWQKMMPNNWE